MYGAKGKRGRPKKRSTSPKKAKKGAGRPKGAKGDKLKAVLNKLVKVSEEDRKRARDVTEVLTNQSRIADRRFATQERVLQSMKDRQDKMSSAVDKLDSNLRDDLSELNSALEQLLNKKPSGEKDGKVAPITDMALKTDLSKIDVYSIVERLADNRSLVTRYSLAKALKQAKAVYERTEKQIEKQLEQAARYGAGDQTAMIDNQRAFANQGMANGLIFALTSARTKVGNRLANVLKVKGTAGKNDVKNAIDAILNKIKPNESGFGLFRQSVTPDSLKGLTDKLKEELRKQNMALRNLGSQVRSGSSFLM